MRGQDPMQSQQEYAAMMQRSTLSAQGYGQPPREMYQLDQYGVSAAPPLISLLWSTS